MTIVSSTQGLSQLGDDDPRVGERAGDIVEQVRPAVLQLALLGHRPVRVDQDRHPQLLSLLVKPAWRGSPTGGNPDWLARS